MARADLDNVLDEVVEGLLSSSPAILMLGKDSFNAISDVSFDTALDRLQGGLTQVMLTDDAAEGVAAFLEKRDPEWSGK